MGAFNATLWGGGAPAGVVTVSARGLIYGAFRLLGVLRPGQTASDASYEDGLTALNEMVDSWNTERLTVKSIAREVIPANGSTTYVAGPNRIENAGYIPVNGTERPIEPLTQARWAETDKTQTGEPRELYVDYGPVEATLYPTPIPADGSLTIYQWTTVEAFGDQDTVYAVPQGYAKALRFCLANDLAPSFKVITKIDQPLLDKIAAQAIDAKAKIKSLNTPVQVMDCDEALVRPGRTYDILSNTYV